MMNIAGTTTTDDIPPEVLEQMENQETVDFGYVGTDATDFPGGLGFIFDAFGVILGSFSCSSLRHSFHGFRWRPQLQGQQERRAWRSFTLQTELAIRAANSQMLAPKKTVEQKLAELDGLLARGVITRDEYTQARLKALTD